MTFQDLNSASPDSLPSFPLALTEIALCTAALWQGKVQLSEWFAQFVSVCSGVCMCHVHTESCALQALTQTPDLQQRGLGKAFFIECHVGL